MCVCRGTWPFSSRNTSSFASGGGVLVSAMARTRIAWFVGALAKDEGFLSQLVCSYVATHSGSS
jgi:hypothetical protein